MLTTSKPLWITRIVAAALRFAAVAHIIRVWFTSKPTRTITPRERHTMPEDQRIIVASHVITCDICGARVESETYGEGQTYSVARNHGNQRMREGWRLFISRSRRWYCPQHEPKPGHRMDELTEGRA